MKTRPVLAQWSLQRGRMFDTISEHSRNNTTILGCQILTWLLRTNVICSSLLMGYRGSSPNATQQARDRATSRGCTSPDSHCLEVAWKIVLLQKNVCTESLWPEQEQPRGAWTGFRLLWPKSPTLCTSQAKQGVHVQLQAGQVTCNL